MDGVLRNLVSRSKTPIKSISNMMRQVYRNPILPKMVSEEKAPIPNVPQTARTNKSVTSIKKHHRINLSGINNPIEDVSAKVSVNLSRSKIPTIAKTERQPLTILNEPSTRIRTESQNKSQDSIRFDKFVGLYNNQRRLKDLFTADKKISKLLDVEDQERKLNDKRYFKNLTTRRSMHYRQILYKAEKLKRGNSPLLQNITYNSEFARNSIKLEVPSMLLLEISIKHLKQSSHLSTKLQQQLELAEENIEHGNSKPINLISQLHTLIDFMLYQNYNEMKVEVQLMQTFFYDLLLTHQELFIIKDSISNALFELKYNTQQIVQAFCQMEQYRYFAQKPPPFIVKSFTKEGYSELVMAVFTKLLKNQNYLSILPSQIKETILTRLQSSLLPFIIGNYKIPLQEPELKLYDFKYTMIMDILNIQLLNCLEATLIDNELDIWLTNDITRRIKAFLNIQPNRTYELGTKQLGKSRNSKDFYQALLYNWSKPTPNLSMVSSYDIWTILCMQPSNRFTIQDDSDGEFENVQLLSNFKSFEALMNYYME